MATPLALTISEMSVASLLSISRIASSDLLSLLGFPGREWILLDGYMARLAVLIVKATAAVLPTFSTSESRRYPHIYPQVTQIVS